MKPVSYPASFRVGLLADSHGNAAVTRAAVRRLESAGVDLLIHLGDLETDSVLDALASPLPAHIVFGNCDWNLPALSEYAAAIGLIVNHPAGRILVGDIAIAFAHGHEPRYESEAINAACPYFCHGHTHVRRDERIQCTRCLNPGALHRASGYTVARLVPAMDLVEFLNVPRVASEPGRRP